jgi:hypothetical protein
MPGMTTIGPVKGEGEEGLVLLNSPVASHTTYGRDTRSRVGGRTSPFTGGANSYHYEGLQQTEHQ